MDPNKEEIRKQFERNEVLSGKHLCDGNDRDEWKKRLDEANDYYTMVSLFHYGLNGEMTGQLSRSDTICIYLQYAYGYKNYSSFRDPEEEYIQFRFFIDGQERYPTMGEIKQLIAKKALSVLAQKFFKDESEGNSFKQVRSLPSWWYIISHDEGLFLKILDFFSFSKNIPSGKNLDHTEEIVVDFLYKLATEAWKFSHMGWFQELLIKHHTEFIKILCNLNELDFLTKNWKLLAREDVEDLKILGSQLRDRADNQISFEDALVSNEKIAECYFLIEQKIKMSGKQVHSRDEIIKIFKGNG